MLELEPTHFYFDPVFWLILGVIMIIVEILFGLNFFILPLGISAFLLSLLLELEFIGIYVVFDEPIFTNWKDILFAYSLFSIISVSAIKLLFSKTQKDIKDINDY